MAQKKMTPQAALYRVNYARKTGQTPTAEDLILAGTINKAAVRQQKEQASLLRQSIQPDTISQQTVQEHQYSVAEAQSSYSEDKKQETARSLKSKAAKEWLEFTEHRLGPLMILVLFLALGDMEKAQFYAFSPDEAKQLAPHVARLAPKVEGYAKVPPWLHDMLVSSDDIVSLATFTVGYLDRIGMIDRMIPMVARAVNKGGLDEQVRQYTQKVQPSSNGNGERPANISDLPVYGLGQQYQ